MVNVKHVIMRDKIQKIVVQATAGTKDLTEAIDQLCDLHNVSKCECGKISDDLIHICDDCLDRHTEEGN